MFRKKYRIVKMDSVYHLLDYKIQERYTILFFIHWWSTPVFAPPHLHESYKSAHDYILEQDPRAIIINEEG